MSQIADGRAGGRTDGRADGRTDGRVGGRTDGRTGERTDERITDGWMARLFVTMLYLKKRDS